YLLRRSLLGCRLRPAIEPVHSDGCSIDHHTFDRVAGALDARRDLAYLRRRERRQHVLDDVPSSGRPSDTHSHAGEPGTEPVDDRTDTTMAGAAAVRPHAQLARGQIEIVVNYHQPIIRRELELRQRFTAAIHERVGLRQADGVTVDVAAAEAQHG